MDLPAQKRVSKACDACKRRKVKCNGKDRCQQCAHLGLRCIYSPSSKHRSQGKRGHIISEFRNRSYSGSVTSPPLLPAGAGQGGFQVPYSSLSPPIERHGSDASMSYSDVETKPEGYMLTRNSISSVTFPGSVQQSLLSGPYPGLHGRRLSGPAGYLRK